MQKSVLERYYQRGWLKYGFKLFSQEDRLRAGQRFYMIYTKSHLLSVGVVDFLKPFVDGGLKGNLNENRLMGNEKFLKILKKLSIEEREILEKVIVREEVFDENALRKEKRLRQIKKTLCRALDRLIFYYLEDENDAK